MDQMDGGGPVRPVKVVGKVERLDGQSLTYPEFVDRFMKPNLPVVLTGLTSSWPSCGDWTLAGPDDRRRPNLPFFAQNFSSPRVQVADCSAREYTDHKRLEMSMQEFVDHWVRNSNTGSSSAHCEASSLYLKDWHFVKEYPDYVAYTTPPFFVDDWLNMYLDSHPMHRDSDIANHKNEVNCADYRFVYIGAKGTWTALHADVFRSYSWSANVCGRKLWLFLAPSQSHLIFDRNLRSSVYDINEDVSEKQFPEFNKAEWIECIQEQNDIIFVPSGWYHQVYNLEHVSITLVELALIDLHNISMQRLEDTISINHNWFNAYNLHWVWNLLHEDYKVAKEYIEDIRDICDNFEALCQHNLAANTGMNFYDFFIFITRFVLTNVIELYHIQEPEDAKHNSPEASQHYVYNLIQIREVASKMISAEAFSIENLCVVSEGNRSAMSDVTKVLKDDGFRRLWMTFSEAYEYIRRGQRILYEMRYLSQKGCLSVTCLKSDCDVVDRIAFLMSEIQGPEDLVRLIDTALHER